MAKPSNLSATQRRLLDAASLEILERGYSASTLASIAARLGMTKGAYAYHYPSKRAIAVALIDHQIALLSLSNEQARATYEGGGLRGLIDVILMIGENNAVDPIYAAASTVGVDPVALDLALPDTFPFWRDIVESYLVEGIALGEVDPSTNPTEAAGDFLTTMIGLAFVQRRKHRSFGSQPLRFLAVSLRLAGALAPEPLIDEVVRARHAIAPDAPRRG
ncbi:TetR/AcrR family transcriptional regulator [Agromyces atrinae]|uniref:TetR/AcrR family transcriptional regulator n=1 Tax=Agromyces atrinae TaxID=592376 RepID=UPI001F5ADF3F|nr:TetR/AcrR family transcriptional regulator [Agromyces atrinae]MCI2957569.1 TetR/AcrR family transcriptional regulator [Agromyces atrinae]